MSRIMDSDIGYTCFLLNPFPYLRETYQVRSWFNAGDDVLTSGHPGDILKDFDCRSPKWNDLLAGLGVLQCKT